MIILWIIVGLAGGALLTSSILTVCGIYTIGRSFEQLMKKY